MTVPPSRRYIGETILRRYRIEQLVGEGSFAWVYRARDQDGEFVAVKILHSTQPTATVRFAREVRVLQGIPDNPNIAGYIDHGHSRDGRPALVLEYVDGITLKVGLERRQSLEEEKAVTFMAELCEAFVGLHQLGVAHRDVKPENIIMARKGGIKLIDFGLIRDAQGLLKLLEGEDPLETRVFQEELDRGVLAGTPEYMAPEQFSDSAVADITQARTDTWSDVFSLGVILFELLTGRKPFVMREVPREEYPSELLRYLRWRLRLRDKDIPRVPSISSAFQSIVQKALRRDPRRRQPDARALMEDLLRYQQTGQGIGRTDESQTMVASISHVMSVHDLNQQAAQRSDTPPKTGETKAFNLFEAERRDRPAPAQETADHRFAPKDVRTSSSEEDAPWAPVGRGTRQAPQPHHAPVQPGPRISPQGHPETIDAGSAMNSGQSTRDISSGHPSQRPIIPRHATLDLQDDPPPPVDRAQHEAQTRQHRIPHQNERQVQPHEEPTARHPSAEGGAPGLGEDLKTTVHRALVTPAKQEQSQLERFFPEDEGSWPEENLADPPDQDEPAILRAPTDAPSLGLEDFYRDWDEPSDELDAGDDLFVEGSDEVNLADLAPGRRKRSG